MIIRMVNLLFLMILVFEAAFAQPLPIVVKGKITDEQTGQPIGVDIEFRSTDGRKIKINSNSISGEYQQVLNAGEFYEVILTGPNIIRKVDRLKVDHFDSYDEQEQNFTVIKLEPGRAIFKITAFDKGSNQINKEELESIFSEIQEIMKFNRAVNFEFVVNAKDTYKKSPIIEYKEEPKTKGKKKKPTKPEPRQLIQPDPSPEQVKSLVDARIEQINSLLEDNSWKRYIKRISIAGDYNLGEPSNLEKFDVPNLLIVVKSIDAAMERN